MTMKRRNLMTAAAAGALALAGATTASAQEVTLRLHQFLPVQAGVPANIIEPWIAQIEEASGGRVEIEHYPSMQLGGTPPELIDQVQDGVVDIVWTVSGYTPGRYPRAEVFELPFTMTDAEATSRAYWTLAEETMMDADFAELKILGLWVHGPGLIHSTDPVETVADLNGVKLRAPTRVTNMLFSNLGATAVGMPVPAIPENLSKGVIDATVIPWEVTGALRTSELVTNHTDFGDAALYTTTFIYAMNLDTWNSLPADIQEIFDAHSGEEFSAWAGMTMQGLDAGGLAIAEDLGNNIINLTPEQVAEWQAAAAPTIDQWIAEADEAGIDGTGLRARSLELIAEYSN